MYVRYAASIEKIADDKANWASDNSAVFEKVTDSKHYIKEIYFYPSNPPEPVWLWVIGHEKARPNKAIIDRKWQTRWCFHICVGGKGTYNGQPIGKGDCFLSWPFLKHSIVADPDDPLEFYWLIFRGDMLNEFVYERGFRSSQLFFKTDATDSIMHLFEIGMSADYTSCDIYEYTMGLAKMILSYHNNKNLVDDEYNPKQEYGRSYPSMARQLLRDSNYSLSVAELASKIGIGANHLGKVFYKDKNETLKHYISRKRIERAEVFLSNGMPPTEVARVVGYTNYSAFYRAFFERYSVSPTQYAKNASDRDRSDT